MNIRRGFRQDAAALAHPTRAHPTRAAPQYCTKKNRDDSLLPDRCRCAGATAACTSRRGSSRRRSAACRGSTAPYWRSWRTVPYHSRTSRCARAVWRYGNAFLVQQGRYSLLYPSNKTRMWQFPTPFQHTLAPCGFGTLSAAVSHVSRLPSCRCVAPWSVSWAAPMLWTPSSAPSTSGPRRRRPWRRCGQGEMLEGRIQLFIAGQKEERLAGAVSGGRR